MSDEIEEVFHYVYRITEINTKMYYYGDRTSKVPPKEDIGKKYFSSFKGNYLFQLDQKANPQNYKYKVIKVFKSSDGFKRADATKLEIKLHNKFDVKTHKKFINKSNQTSTKFSVAGTKLSEDHKRKISTKGRNHSEETKQKISKAQIGKIVTGETKKKTIDYRFK